MVVTILTLISVEAILISVEAMNGGNCCHTHTNLCEQKLEPDGTEVELASTFRVIKRHMC